jgi:hypothetical protein
MYYYDRETGIVFTTVLKENHSHVKDGLIFLGATEEYINILRDKEAS